MLQGVKPLVFIRVERNQGDSEKKKENDFASITLSDGLEILKLDIVPSLAEHCQATYKKGDKIKIVVDVSESNNRTTFVVIAVSKSS